MTPGTANTTNVLNSAANISLVTGGVLGLTGNTTNNVTEMFNSLGFTNADTVAITGAAGTTTTLTAGATTGSVVRTGSATGLILGTNLGQNGTTGNAQFLLGDGGASLGLVGTNTLSGAGTDTT